MDPKFRIDDKVMMLVPFDDIVARSFMMRGLKLPKTGIPYTVRDVVLNPNGTYALRFKEIINVTDLFKNGHMECCFSENGHMECCFSENGFVLSNDITYSIQFAEKTIRELKLHIYDQQMKDYDPLAERNFKLCVIKQIFTRLELIYDLTDDQRTAFFDQYMALENDALERIDYLYEKKLKNLKYNGGN